MAPYSMELRTRVLRDSAAGLSSKDLAAKYAVNRAWVDRVKQLGVKRARLHRDSRSFAGAR